jgi:hypothetical protein
MQAQVQSPTVTGSTSGFSLDLGPIARAVGRELRGEVPAERIEQRLRELLDQQFSEAKVTTFLPILLHRSACESLRAEAMAARKDALP